MPIYGYRCRSCGHEFEVLQKMSDSPFQTCPKCAGQLTKIVYAAGIVYKGSGYYSTDYKAASKGSEAGASNGTSRTGSDGSGDGQPGQEPTEAKTESKTGSKKKAQKKSRAQPKSELKTAPSDADSL